MPIFCKLFLYHLKKHFLEVTKYHRNSFSFLGNGNQKTFFLINLRFHAHHKIVKRFNEHHLWNTVAVKVNHNEDDYFYQTGIYMLKQFIEIFFLLIIFIPSVCLDAIKLRAFSKHVRFKMTKL